MDRAEKIAAIRRQRKIEQIRAMRTASPASPTEAEQPAEPGIGSKIVSGALKAGDYIGGLARTAAYNNPMVQMAEEIKAYKEGKASPNTLSRGSEELLAALKGNPKSSSELLETRGIGELGSVQLPVLGKTTGRGAVGFLSDVALDPLTYLTLGETAAGKAVAQQAAKTGLKGAAGKVAKVGMTLLDPSELIAGAGKRIYKGGFGSIDKELAAKGAQPITDMLFEQGFKGSAEDARKFAKQLGQDAISKRQKIYEQLAEKRIKPDFSDAEAVVAKMSENPGLKNKAKDLQDFIEQYKLEDLGGAQGPKQLREYGVQNASDIKSSLQQSLPESAYVPNEYGGKTLSAPAKQVDQKLGSAFKEAISDVAPAVDNLNSVYGTTKEASKLLAREARKGARKKGFTIMDAVLGGAALGNPYTLAILAAKKAAEAANTTTGRTYIGQGLKAAAPAISSAYRHMFINASGNAD